LDSIARMKRFFRGRSAARLEVAVWIFALFVLFSGDAFAWGPATHSLLTSWVVDGTIALPAALYSLVRRFRLDFLYGSLAPDVIVAKSFCEESQHCHRWDNGFRILHAARDDAERAFALGYLAHLAADVVAHNRFVPERMRRLRLPSGLAHAYIEMRADDRVDYRHWDATRRIGRARERRHDRLLNSVLTMTLLPYGANKAIFTGLSLLSKRRAYRAILRRAGESSRRLPIARSEIEPYHRESALRIESVLARLDRSEVLSEDPIGRAALANAVAERRRDRDRAGIVSRSMTAFLVWRELSRENEAERTRWRSARSARRPPER